MPLIGLPSATPGGRGYAQGLIIVMPILAILIAIPLARMYEYPMVSPGFDPEEIKRPMAAEDKQTLAMYAKVSGKSSEMWPRIFTGADKEKSWSDIAHDKSKWQEIEKDLVSPVLALNQRPPHRASL